MHKYRKRPVIIEAFQMTPAARVSNVDWPEWMHRAWQKDRYELGSLYPTVEGTGDGTLSIRTLEGEALVSWGDWIIQGVPHELYPCKPEIFEATYDPVVEISAGEETSPPPSPSPWDYLDQIEKLEAERAVTHQETLDWMTSFPPFHTRSKDPEELLKGLMRKDELDEKLRFIDARLLRLNREFVIACGTQRG